MGTTPTTTGTEKRNCPTFSVNTVQTFVYCFLSGLITLGIYGPIADKQATERTLKLCNEKASECKFKYDILIYQETGKVPTIQNDIGKKSN